MPIIITQNKKLKFFFQEKRVLGIEKNMEIDLMGLKIEESEINPFTWFALLVILP